MAASLAATGSATWLHAEDGLAPVTSPRTFTPPNDAKPVWLPQRPTSNIRQAAEQAPAEVVMPATQNGWTPSRPSANNGLPAGYDQSQTVPATRSNAAWQSGLKWRVRNPNEFAASREVSETSGGLDNERVAEHMRSEARHIRQTSQLQQTNPFSNPFGDRQTFTQEQAQPGQAPAPVVDPANMPAPNNALPQNPPAAQPNPDAPLVPPVAPVEPPPVVQPPMNPPRANDEPPLFRAPQPLRGDDPAVPRREDLPARPNVFGSPAAPQAGSGVCNRVYNDRDCCDEDQKCNAARQKLRDNPISKISLDITPAYKPDNSDKPATPEKRAQHLGTAPSKSWRNRTGEVLASGRMTNLQGNRVVVTQGDGEVKRLPLQELSDDDLCFVSAWWGLPSECTMGDEPYASREWLASTVTWKASAICHKPLYFEEPQLERYGHTTGPISQPVVSGAHFFLNIAGLPYKMGINPMNECQYPLGYYRPGSCAPWLLPPFPVSLRGALMEAGAVVGGVFIIP